MVYYFEKDPWAVFSTATSRWLQWC